MAKYFVFLNGKNEVIPELSPPPVNGTSDGNDIRADLLRQFITTCADAGDYLKPKLKAVSFLTEQFSGLSITIKEAVKTVQESPRVYPGYNEAKANLPEIFRW